MCWRVPGTSFWINSKDVADGRRAVWSHFSCFFWHFKTSPQLLPLLKRTLLRSFPIKLQRCFTDHETSPACPSTWGWVDDYWSFTLGWTLPLRPKRQYKLTGTLRNALHACSWYVFIWTVIFRLECHFSGLNQSNGNGSLLQLVDGGCEDVTRTSAEGGKWTEDVHGLDKRVHKPLETTVMLMQLDLI